MTKKINLAQEKSKLIQLVETHLREYLEKLEYDGDSWYFRGEFQKSGFFLLGRIPDKYYIVGISLFKPEEKNQYHKLSNFVSITQEDNSLEAVREILRWEYLTYSDPPFPIKHTLKLEFSTPFGKIIEPDKKLVSIFENIAKAQNRMNTYRYRMDQIALEIKKINEE